MTLPRGPTPSRRSHARPTSARLRALATEFTLAHPEGDVAAFVEELSGRFSVERNARGVNLLTYHRAKGLEFDAVFLPRLLDGELPFRSGRSKADPDEERRLLYVGITRARRYLFLTWPTDAKAARSPFLDDLGIARQRPTKPARGPRVSIGAGGEVFDRLKGWRRKRAEADGVPAYVVFSNKTLEEIAVRSPGTGPTSRRYPASDPPSSSATATRSWRSWPPAGLSRPSAVIGTASAFDTGQPSFADSAASRNPSASIPGTSPETHRRLPVMPSPFWKSTSARVLSVVAGCPGLRKDARQLHREARGVGSGEQLLRARAPPGLLGASRPGDVEGPQPAGVERHLAAALEQRSVPFPCRDACRGHGVPLSSVRSNVPRQRRIRLATTLIVIAITVMPKT